MFFRTERFRDFLQFYPVVSVIIALQILIWLLGFVPSIGNSIYIMGAGVNGLISQGEYWRLVTPIFLHGGFTHVLFNSFSLVLFAPALEQMLGKWKFISLYLMSGIAANILTYIVEPNPYYIHVGASGAIYGLFGIYIFMVFFEKKLIDSQDARVVLIITIIGLILTFIRPNINIAGHVFGFIAGFALGPILLNNAQAFSPWKNKRRVKHDDEIGFDPNRWNKKRFRSKPNPYVKKILFGVLIALVILGVISRLF
ncbi:rhomboid family intramembrane serine protease [Gracilibacillus sp. S3-1-1]|uniref:Rhomboid family intramembrane serine protease n=1 Tax=Gracilibacillus pellucidus TaxID=3095368 RepID=A0ACC6M5R6_9BACI|nr:rhomboid family intramembrane serine protease [Gracilibacillus sp. S3-1-1]MDX8046314.1 rhomboid family intramembrane serine protease [Gracilibacillus sp. S3-1-1]